MGTGMGVTHDDRVAGTDEAALRKEGVTDAVGSDIKKILDIVTAGPVAQDLGLGGGFCVLAGGDMVDNRLDLCRIKDAILAAPDQVINRNRRGNLVAEHRIQAQHFGAGKGLVYQVSIKYFLCSCFTHFSTSHDSVLTNL